MVYNARWGILGLSASISIVYPEILLTREKLPEASPKVSSSPPYLG